MIRRSTELMEPIEPIGSAKIVARMSIAASNTSEVKLASIDRKWNEFAEVLKKSKCYIELVLKKVARDLTEKHQHDHIKASLKNVREKFEIINNFRKIWRNPY